MITNKPDIAEIVRQGAELVKGPSGGFYRMPPTPHNPSYLTSKSGQETTAEDISDTIPDLIDCLTVMNGYSKLLFEEIPQDDPHRSDVEELYYECKRAIEIMKNMRYTTSFEQISQSRQK